MKKIEIIIRREQGQWLARVSKLPDIDWDIQKYGDSKIRTLKSVQSKALRELGNLHENHNLELNGVVFKVTDLSTSGKPLKRLRERIIDCWKNTLNWMTKKPYLELFLEFLLVFGGCCLAFSFFILVFYVAWLIYSLIQDQQLFVTLVVSSIAFFGVLLTAAIQIWIATYKTRIEKQNESLKKMTDYYEKIIKLLRNPRAFSSKEVSAFLNVFSDKVEIYGSSNILYQWKQLKKKMVVAQSTPLKTEIINLHGHNFRNFIWAIRKEMGHFSISPMNRSYILEELEDIYKDKKNEDSIKHKNIV